MTCKRAHHSHTLSGFTLFVAVLTFLVAVAAHDAMASSPPLFLPAVTYDTGGYEAGFVTVADVNNDGKPDLIVANTYYSNTVGVLLGKGDGSFRPVMTYDSGAGGPISIIVADMNGDGKLDLVVANQTPCYSCSGGGVVSVLLGNGDGTFGSAVTCDSGGFFATSVAVADVNGDGKLDVAAANCASSASSTCGDENGMVAVLLGKGDGTFQPAVSYDSGGTVAASVAIEDVNGDSKLDLLVTNSQCVFTGNCSNSEVAVLLGNADGTFQHAVTFSTGGWGSGVLAVLDVNSDGKSDVLVGTCGSSDCWAEDQRVGVLLGNGDGGFQSAVTYDSGGRIPDGLAVADVDGDGKLDVLAANVIDLSVGVLLGNGDGTFRSPVTYASGGGYTYSVAVADVNNDHKLDLLVSSCGPAGGGCGGGIDGLVGVLLNNAPDITPPAITISATPKVLWPPNGKMVPVTVSGTTTDTGSGVNSAAYAVKDEYGEVQPTGVITLSTAGNYSFIILLQASRRDTDLDGRRYTVTVRAKDKAGNVGWKMSNVIVPHDQ